MTRNHSAIVIAPATTRNAYSILVLTRAYFPYVQLGYDELQGRLHKQAKGQKGGEHYYYVARKVGHTIGYAHLAFDPRKRSARLLGLGVLDTHRRKGIGRRLLQACLRKARAKGAHTLNLLVSEDNTASRALYQAHHFQLKGKLAKPFGGKRILVYRKVLTHKPAKKALKPARAT